MKRPVIQLKYCYECGMVRVETANITHCPVCNKATQWTEIEAKTITDEDRVVFLARND